MKTKNKRKNRNLSKRNRSKRNRSKRSHTKRRLTKRKLKFLKNKMRKYGKMEYQSNDRDDSDDNITGRIIRKINSNSSLLYAELIQKGIEEGFIVDDSINNPYKDYRYKDDRDIDLRIKIERVKLKDIKNYAELIQLISSNEVERELKPPPASKPPIVSRPKKKK